MEDTLSFNLTADFLHEIIIMLPLGTS